MTKSYWDVCKALELQKGHTEALEMKQDLQQRATYYKNRVYEMYDYVSIQAHTTHTLTFIKSIREYLHALAMCKLASIHEYLYFIEGCTSDFSWEK